MENTGRKSFLAITTAILIFFFAFLGTFQFHKNITNTTSFLRSFTCISISASEINNFIKSTFSNENPEKSKSGTAPINKENQTNKIFSTLFLLMSAILMSHEEIFLIFLVISFVCLCSRLKKIFNRNKNILMLPNIKYYLWWSLSFLTPVEKSIMNRADEYDINPIKRL